MNYKQRMVNLFIYSLLIFIIFVQYSHNRQKLDDIEILESIKPIDTHDEKNTQRSSKVPQLTNQAQNNDSVEYDIYKFNHSTLLKSDIIPGTIFTIWCGRRWFEFHNYISLLSVVKELRPDNFIFYHDTWPVVDQMLYNTWFDELRESYAFFRPYALSATEHACTQSQKPNETFIRNLLQYWGGMYISEFTMLNVFPHKMRNYDHLHISNPDGSIAILMSKPGIVHLGINSAKSSCVSPSEFEKTSKKVYCLHLSTLFFPKDIWNGDGRFARAVRKIFYGNSSIPKPRQSYSELIPNIAHIAWLGGGQMDYLFYLCVLSLIYVAKVEMVYVHGDSPPSGIHWRKIKNHPQLMWIRRENPYAVFGNTVNVISHMTDVWRVDWMIKYGGIYVDTDTVFVKPLDRDIRSYDAVGSVDWTYWNHPFPDTINFGVAIGKRNAPFWSKFQNSMKWFLDDDWSWNGLRQPYKIKERDPTLVKIDPSLQVICYQYLCHPTWHPEYHNESIHHLNNAPIRNWRTETYAFHFTLPTPPELHNQSVLVKSNSMFGEIGKYILYKAGLLNNET